MSETVSPSIIFPTLEPYVPYQVMSPTTTTAIPSDCCSFYYSYFSDSTVVPFVTFPATPAPAPPPPPPPPTPQQQQQEQQQSPPTQRRQLLLPLQIPTHVSSHPQVGFYGPPASSSAFLDPAYEDESSSPQQQQQQQQQQESPLMPQQTRDPQLHAVVRRYEELLSRVRLEADGHKRTIGGIRHELREKNLAVERLAVAAVEAAAAATSFGRRGGAGGGGGGRECCCCCDNRRSCDYARRSAAAAVPPRFVRPTMAVNGARHRATGAASSTAT